MLRTICGCSDDSLIEIIEGNRTTDHFLMECLIENMGDCVVKIKPYDELSQQSKDLIEWCIDFLAYQKEFRDAHFPKQLDGYHKNKYITLWSFIYGFLRIEKNGGIDYLLMNLLDWYDFSEHGSGIRCSWLDYKINRKCPEERVKIITNWASNTTDDI